MKSYDIVVSNPPYFLPHQGRLSPKGKQRNICRFFLDQDSIEFFFRSIVYSIRPNVGFALFSTRFTLEMVRAFLKQYSLDQEKNIQLKVVQKIAQVLLIEIRTSGTTERR
jgi:tRNA1(Val) A37 N6-methylase TrmN6